MNTLAIQNYEAMVVAGELSRSREDGSETEKLDDEGFPLVKNPSENIIVRIQSLSITNFDFPCSF